MTGSLSTRGRLSIGLFLLTATLSAQLRPDPQLSAEIARIKAIDNHAHPVRIVAPNEKDMEFDALPVDTMDPYTEPIRTRPESGEATQAHKALYGAATRKSVMDKQGDNYPNWVLDQLGIEVMLANRVAMGTSIAPPRFLWVPYADALMYPLKNDVLIARAPDYKELFADEERLLQRYLKDSDLTAVPAFFEEYLRNVVTPTLERQKAGGAIAVKFEAAYLRALRFGNPTRSQAERVFTVYAHTPPPAADYKILQDFLFRYIALECGRLGMAVHLHAAAGAGGYFDIAGSNPMNMEPLFNDPTLRKTKFVMIHGGWPFTHELTALLSKPNVYLDFSEQTFNNYPRAVAEAIRGWLEFAPEKVMFATDAYPFSDAMGWEEAGYLAARTGREALALALTGMMADGEITRIRALELARMVLRDNARGLYGLK